MLKIVVVVATAMTPTPSTTNRRSMYQLALDSVGRMRMWSSGGRMKDTMEMVKQPSVVKEPAAKKKDIERHDHLEAGDEIGQQTRDHHNAQALQHALPVGHHRLGLRLRDPGLAGDQCRIDGNGIRQEAYKRQTHGRTDVPRRLARNVRQNDILNTPYFWNGWKSVPSAFL